MNNLDILIASELGGNAMPSHEQMSLWTAAALPSDKRSAQVCLRVVDEQESRAMNLLYRKKDSPTNVLSFPCDFPANVGHELIGDLLVCAPLVNRQAIEQNKHRDAHWAHMLIHGTLHLCGYDHVEDSQAQVMEALETKILTSLGFAPPYEQLYE